MHRLRALHLMHGAPSQCCQHGSDVQGCFAAAAAVNDALADWPWLCPSRQEARLGAGMLFWSVCLTMNTCGESQMWLKQTMSNCDSS